MDTQAEHRREPGTGQHQHGLTLPIIGYVLSVALTLIALWAVMNHVLGNAGLITLILSLAVVQIFIQLFGFMHVTESRGHPWHAWMLGLGFIFVIAIVAGSIWIMTFGAETY